MLIFKKSGLMVENSDELDTPLSLSCAAENLRMAAFYFDKARNLLEHRSGSAKLNGSDKCIIGVFRHGKGAFLNKPSP